MNTGKDVDDYPRGRRSCFPKCRTSSDYSESSETTTATTATASTTSYSSTASVRFSDYVETYDVPSLSTYSEKELNVLFMSERDYQSAYEGIQETLRLLQKESCSEHELSTYGLHYITPSGQYIRETLRRTAKHVVLHRHQQQQQQHQHQQQQQQQQQDCVAAVYIPVSMQAQLMAYERAMLNAIELNQFDDMTNITSMGGMMNGKENNTFVDDI
jgi:hypothetical protein